MTNVSALITGFGSIGRRHLRNLRALGINDITVYRTGRSTLPDDELTGVVVEYDLDNALAKQPTAVFVANPTALHLQTALAAARAGSHIFMEKPVSHTMDGIDELRQLVDEKERVFFTGFQFRFHPGLIRVKQLLDQNAVGQIVSVQAHWGEYLPDWHPWEDYRTSYSALPELGGGVTLTLCHPLDYLRWLIGEVQAVSAHLGYNGLDIEAEDTADIHLHFESGVLGNVHLDYLQRPSQHGLRLIGQQGTILWDNKDGSVQCYQVDHAEWETFPMAPDFERNTLFLDETRHFLACIDGTETSRCTLHDGIRALQIVLAAKQSSSERKVITL